MSSARRPKCISAVLALVVCSACGTPPTGPGGLEPVVWSFDSLEQIGGHSAVALGSPLPEGGAVKFDGLDDGLELPLHPLAGAKEFTIEAVFRPDPGGEREQRFLHLQEDGSKDRILLETRTTGDGKRWFLDSYIKSRGEGYTLFAKGHEHPIGPWYHAALVVDGSRMRHYVNGELELEREIDFRPQQNGRTSIGMRINRVSWFRGAIKELRFTRKALSPGDLSGN